MPITKTEIKRVRRSEKLDAESFARLKGWINEQETKQDAADLLQIHRNNLSVIVLKGSCHPDTARRIKRIIWER